MGPVLLGALVVDVADRLRVGSRLAGLFLDALLNCLADWDPVFTVIFVDIFDSLL